MACDEEIIAEVYSDFRAARSRGLPPQAILNSGSFRFAPDEVKQAVLQRFEEDIRRVRRIPDPGAIIDRQQRGEVWYVPSSEDELHRSLEQRLREKGMPASALEALDESSTRILNDLRPPGESQFDTRGLVLGHVQSGKTTSFMTLAAKAADQGYRLIIVLSGITNNLRQQTQKRLEADLVGMGEDRKRWYRLTDADNDFTGDKNASNVLGREDHRVLAVVKKNPRTLEKLLAWLKAGGRDAENCPILVIDDEADQASINIAKPGDVSRINKLLRSLLEFPKAAYVAYTATPFANLLIDTKDVHDLYPKDFIRALVPGEGYFGAEQIFGRALLDHEEDVEADGMDVLRTILKDEVDDVRPPRGTKPDEWSPSLPDSLRDAIDWFLLATAARRALGQGDKHSSMLVHTSMSTVVQESVAEVVDAHLAARRGRVLDGHEGVLAHLEQLWTDETARVEVAASLTWDAVRVHLPDVVADCTVAVDNYMSDRRLSYSEEEPDVLIAIGGNTLSRGLTLEGLVCSYFVRASTTYDTLLQMGRWFGYRKGYVELMRIWMTEELAGWFRDLATVEAEIRLAIDDMAVQDRTPAELPIAIRTHPAMSVTSAARMQSARQARVSYSGAKEQTIQFEVQDAEVLRANWEAGESLVLAGLADQRVEEVRDPSGAAQLLLRDVPVERVKEFLTSYSFEETRRLQPKRLVDYIDLVGADLAFWDVFLMGRLGGPTARFAGREVNLLTRNRISPSNAGPGKANIKALTGSQDRGIGVTRNAAEHLGRENPSTDSAWRDLRQALGSNPLLGLYPIDKDSTPTRQQGSSRGKVRLPLQSADHVLGVALFFPQSTDHRNAVDYVSANLTEEETEIQAEYEAQLDQIRAEEGE